MQILSATLLQEAERLGLTDQESLVFLGPPYHQHRSPKDADWEAVVRQQKDAFQMMLCGALLQDVVPGLALTRWQKHAMLLRAAIQRDRGESSLFDAVPSAPSDTPSCVPSRGRDRDRQKVRDVAVALEEQQEDDLKDLLTSLGIPFPTLAGWLDKLNSSPPTNPPSREGPRLLAAAAPLHADAPNAVPCSPASNSHLPVSASSAGTLEPSEGAGSASGSMPDGGSGIGDASGARHGAADSDWRRRLFFISERMLRYKSEKIGTSIVKVCELANIAGAQLETFPDSGRLHCVVLKVKAEGPGGRVSVSFQDFSARCSMRGRCCRPASFSLGCLVRGRGSAV